MARILKEDEYNAKRNEILDAARHLIYTKGYRQMTIQDLLDTQHISRGALYHYFSSKEALLEALVERMGQEAVQHLSPIAQDVHLTGIQKFHRYFEVSTQWKDTQKELIISLMRIWYSDENVIIRQKMEKESRKYMGSYFEQAIRQGIAEESFTTRYPSQTALIIAGMSLSLTDTLIGLMLSPRFDASSVEAFDEILAAYTETIERVLGAPAGSLHAFEPGAFSQWFTGINTAPATE